MKANVFSFKTLGCRLNQAEEERLRREFLEAGHFVSEPRRADICIVNTCSVTAMADKKSHLAIKKLKDENCNLKIVVIGCGAEVAKDYPEVDLWIPNSKKGSTLSIINSKFKILKQNQVKIQNLKPCGVRRFRTARNFGLVGEQIRTTENQNSARTRALLKVQDGCNNFCSYCIVPTLRGREVSLGVEDVIAEAQKLEALGYRELVLSGVNVGRYQDDLQFTITNYQIGEEINLTKLIKIILSDTNFPRIRLSSINPQDITDEMIELWSKETRLCNHFHLSLQSGANDVLKRMGRPYTKEQYIALSKKIVQKIPNMAITTDVIVGFPGETESDFRDTVELIKEVKFAKLHVFRYSKRTGTRAAEFPEQISDTLKKGRSGVLLKLSQVLEKDFKNRFLGKEVEVLFEENKKGYWYGLTDNYIRVKYRSNNDLENQIKKVTIKEEYLMNGDR